MTREEFDKLDVIGQVDYINERLLTLSLTKICDDMGISRTTVTKRFKNSSYIFDKYTNQYQKLEDMTVDNDTVRALEAKINDLNKRVTELEQMDNSKITRVQQTDNSSLIRFYKNNTTVRAYRIDNEIYQRFKQFTDNNKQFKISDIISTALEDFLNKANQ